MGVKLGSGIEAVGGDPFSLRGMSKDMGGTLLPTTQTRLAYLEAQKTSASPPKVVDRVGGAVVEATSSESVAKRDNSWQPSANCLGVDPDLFFPERGASTREAKETCRGCVVRPDCLEYALDNGEKFGIWGGMSERERRRLRRQRALARRELEDRDKS